MTWMPPHDTQSPAPLGFRMPAEWEPHEATWLSWPHNENTWPGKLSAVPPVYANIVRALMPHEKVRILTPNDGVAAEARETLKHHDAWSDNVELIVTPTNDSWARDFGPIFVTRDGADGRREVAATKWLYNAWGGKYPPFDADNEVPFTLARRYDMPLFEAGIILEGGSIDVNGAGTLLTTEACLLNPNRNPHLERQTIELALKIFLGARNVLWLGDGIVGDDTDGHIDDLTRFVNPSTVVTVVEENPDDENHDVLRENLERLRTMADQDGCPLDIVELPMPDAIYHEGQRLPASYANFYMANNVVLVPTYRCANDARAIAILQKLCPDRRVIGIDCVDLVWGLGAIHCITQQQPAGVPARL